MCYHVSWGFLGLSMASVPSLGMILGYMTGIHVQYQLSCSRGEQNGKRRENTGAWKSANLLAEQTMELALAATAHAVAGDYIKADEFAKDASKRLKASEIALPLHPQFTTGQSVRSCRNGMKTEPILHEFGF